MNSHGRLLFAALCIVLLAACGGEAPTGNDGSVATTTTALDLPSLRPVPYQHGDPDHHPQPIEPQEIWARSRVDVLFADAMASCASSWTSGISYQHTPDDVYWYEIAEAMGGTLGCASSLPSGAQDAAANLIVSEYWSELRADPVCNKDPITGEQATYTIEPSESVELTDTLSTGLVFIPSSGEFQEREVLLRNEAAKRVTSDLIRPGYQLCIAQRVRQAQAGTQGADAILLSADEQRTLLYLALDRVQRSMLGFTALANAFASRGPLLWPEEQTGYGLPPEDEVEQLTEARRLPVLLQWARLDDELATDKTAWAIHLGRDFATAVDLHAVLSKEFTEMLARTASAREPTGMDPATLAEELWGPGSWRQRALVALFGGFPLAEAPNTPWQDPFGMTSPYGKNLFPWPVFEQSPYPRFSADRPEAQLFGRLVQKLPSLSFLATDVGGTCYSINRPGSARELYKQLETRLRFESGRCVEGQICWVPYPTASSLDQFELWTRFRLREEDAESYVRSVSNHLDPVCPTGAHSSGMSTVQGHIWLDETTSGATVVRLSSGASFEPRTVSERAGDYTMSPWRMPPYVYSWAPATSQGFPSFAQEDDAARWSSAHEKMMHMGVLNAQVAVREALHSMEAITHDDVYSVPSNARYAAFAENFPETLAVLNTSAGGQSVALRPKVMFYADGTAIVAGGLAGHWQLDVVTADSDGWWSSSDGAALDIIPMANDPWAASKAKSPSSLAFTSSMEDVPFLLSYPAVESATPLEHNQGIAHFTAEVSLGSSFGMWTMIARRMGADGSVDYRVLMDGVSLNPQRTDVGYYVGSGGQLASIAERLWKPSRHDLTRPEFDGFGLPTQWVPPTNPAIFGGSAGEDPLQHYLATAKTAAEESAGAVAYAMQSLIEQEQDEQALKAAELRADQMNEQEVAALCGEDNPSCDLEVETVSLPMLLWKNGWLSSRVGNDDAPLKSICSFREPPPEFAKSKSDWEVDRWTQTIVECTDDADVPECAAAVLTALHPNELYAEAQIIIADINTFLDSFEPSGAGLGDANLDARITPEARAAVASVYCDSLRLVGRFAGQGGFPEEANVEVAKAVADVRDAASQPSFSEYSGGALQSLFIEQWAALNSFQLLADEYMKATDAAAAEVLLAYVAAEHAAEKYRVSCNPKAAADAKAACKSVSCGIPSGCSVTFNPSPMINYNMMCEQLALDVGPAIIAAEASKAEALARVASYGQRFSEASKVVQLTSASIAQQSQATRAAIARNNLDKKLAAMSAHTTYGLYRRYHSYDLWRAKALLESARRYGVIARRSLEARYALDLSRMHADEPFVAAPTSWADEVYAYDLSMPASVGLSSGESQSGGIYANKVYDYVSNLERFVNGYAINRPTSTAQEDTEIISLPGPYSRRELLDDGASSWWAADDAAGWFVYCPDDGSWQRPVQLAGYEPGGEVPSPVDDFLPLRFEPVWLDNPCGDDATPPTRARIEFFLDGWGRLNNTIADPPYEHRHNARWIKLAVNLVGGDILDCTAASDVAQCMSDRIVRYNLSHAGPSWVNTYDGGWHLLSVPTAYVEGGKAIAHNQWLSPLLSSWSQPHVEAAARTELTERPLNGAYQLEIQLDPEVHLERVERIQILAATTYWVSQD